MYEAKSRYYQDKETESVVNVEDREYVQLLTGNQSIDALICALKTDYNAVCRVHLDTDKADRILMPAYLGYGEHEEHFSTLFAKYVAESVEADQRRGVLSFVNYKSIKHQLSEGITPQITYKKTGGRTAVLRVYQIGDSTDDTLWVFAKA